jgi:hypothetical protein
VNPTFTQGKTNPVLKMKTCSKCEQKRIPEGGIEVGPRWYCARCWMRRSASK